MLRHETDDQAVEIVGLLDEFQAAERAGAEAVEGWVGVCRDARLRGGLKVIRTRDLGHASLARFGSSTVSDEEKLGLVLARYPEEGAVRQPIAHVLERFEPDLETRELLGLVAEGEGATVAWLRAYH